jgi:hypothetical protein
MIRRHRRALIGAASLKLFNEGLRLIDDQDFPHIMRAASLKYGHDWQGY